MKGFRKCQHSPVDSDHHSVRHAAEVNKGAQKIMSELPDHLTAMFTWTVVTVAFVLFLVTVTYALIGFELTAAPATEAIAPAASALHRVSKRESSCYPLAASEDPVTPERTGPAADTECRASAFTTMTDVGAGDVHYVFANDTTHVPQLAVCSLESVLRAVGNRGRVNVFVVHGINARSEKSAFRSDEHPVMVPLLSSLDELRKRATYGEHRLNVVHVRLEQCLACSPFRGMDLSNSPGFAAFAVRLAVLWQFGGTVLDTGVVAVGGVYRASGTAVEYDDRTISAAVACHAVMYDAMSRARDRGPRDGEPFGPDAVMQIMATTAATRTGRARSYYAVAVADDPHLDDFCPDVLQQWRVPEKTYTATTTRPRATTHINT